MATTSDSPLSVTANVVGIITFVYVLVVGLSYRATVVARADRLTGNMLQEMLLRQIQIQSWRKFLNKQKNVPQNVELATQAVEREIRWIQAFNTDIVEKLDSFRRTKGSAGWLRWIVYWTWINLRFVQTSDVTRANLDRVDTLLEIAKAVAEPFLSKSESDALVADLQKRVEALERRYGGPSREASSDAASDSSSGSQPAITPGAADLRHVTSVLQPRISAEEV